MTVDRQPPSCASCPSTRYSGAQRTSSTRNGGTTQTEHSDFNGFGSRQLQSTGGGRSGLFRQADSRMDRKRPDGKSKPGDKNRSREAPDSKPGKPPKRGNPATQAELEKEGFKANDIKSLRQAEVSADLVQRLKSEAKFSQNDIVNAARAVNETNRVRQQKGIKEKMFLDLAACKAAKEQAETQKSKNACTHTGKDGSNPFDRISKIVNKTYANVKAGWMDVQENCAKGYRNAEGAVGGWFKSSGHAKNMNGKRLGVGFYLAGDASTMTFVNQRIVT